MSALTKNDDIESSDFGTLVASAAPGAYLGYALQPVRLSFHLLSADPDTIVSMEHLDDVAVQSASAVVLEQTKSATAQNPVSNWSSELWKTFANWIDTIDTGHVSLITTQFRLYVTPPKTGEFVALLNDATTDAAATQAVQHIAKKLSARKAKPAAHEYLDRFFEWDAAKRLELIKRFRFESNDLDPVDPIRHLVRATVSPAMVELCCRYAIGHAKEEADALIRAGKPAQILAGKFRNAFVAFVRKNDLNGLLVSMAPPPSEEVVATTLTRAPTFVRQLEIIDLPVEHQLRAVSDYLQTSVNKTKWADLGLIMRESLEELDRDLERGHALARVELDETHGTADARGRGRILYSRCGNSKVKLEGREVPSHFVPGCYNDLADRLRLGWHSEYMTMLSEIDKSYER
jgi:hypothetical protein